MTYLIAACDGDCANCFDNDCSEHYDQDLIDYRDECDIATELGIYQYSRFNKQDADLMGCY